MTDSRTVTFRQGATHDPLQASAFTSAAPINFPLEFPGGVTFRMVKGSLVIGGAGTVTADESGNLSYRWGDGDLDVADTYAAYFVGIDGEGREEVFPRAYDLVVIVVPRI